MTNKGFFLHSLKFCLTKGIFACFLSDSRIILVDFFIILINFQLLECVCAIVVVCTLYLPFSWSFITLHE